MSKVSMAHVIVFMARLDDWFRNVESFEVFPDVFCRREGNKFRIFPIWPQGIQFPTREKIPNFSDVATGNTISNPVGNGGKD